MNVKDKRNGIRFLYKSREKRYLLQEKKSTNGRLRYFSEQTVFTPI